MKQQLSEALAEAEYRIEQGGLISPPYVDRTLFTLVDTARLVERLLPGKCSYTGEHPHIHIKDYPGVKCDGRVWDEGIVEAVARAIYDGDKVNLHPGDPFVAWDLVILERHRSPWHKQARAVLSVLVELLTEKVEK